ncbi:YqaJ viral recombinase family protein [Streptomyces sp. NPDC057413]|uniref:YqaJ viral recombinase family nuclease n=1 Tax=Streptomyces sp. NPDC057413 TaxID=3346124 RepID=UPI0036A2E305
MTAPTISTPTGVLLGEFAPGSPEWKEARAGLCITATEAAAVVGLSPWLSPFSLWHKKAGLPVAPFETSPEMKWGSRFEDDVAEEFAERHPEHPLLTTGTWRHRDRTWQRATPDRLWGDSLVEIKTAASPEGWGPDGSDEFPVHYRCQVTWQQDTLGLHKPARLAVLILPYDYREYVIEWDPEGAKVLREAAERFLRSVERGERPPIDGHDATYQTIRVQHEGRDDVEVEISAEHAADYEIAQRAAKAADWELVRARGQILDALGTGRWAVHGGRRIAYRTVNPDGTTLALQPARSHTA